MQKFIGLQQEMQKQQYFEHLENDVPSLKFQRKSIFKSSR